jgi:uncharacterized protein YecA (UPF0149 family)
MAEQKMKDLMNAEAAEATPTPVSADDEMKIDKNTLLGQWRAKAYDKEEDKDQLTAFWSDYFQTEKEIYIQLLQKPDDKVSGSVRDLAAKYNIPLEKMVGFLDGINDSLIEKNPIETMTEDTEVSLAFDRERLYKNMVDAKAEWLYGLPEWDQIFTPERKHELYLEQKKSGTIVKPKKIGRNDPCPCGSGKKYKYCCGRNQK